MAKYTRRDASIMNTWDPVLYWYARAVGEMQKRNAGDPTSWVFQARMHGVEGGANLPPPIPKHWNQCPHGGWYFLPWHRAYIWYFERIVRATIKKIAAAEGITPDPSATWALPYWNYALDPAGTEPAFTSRALPAAFREPQMPSKPDGSGPLVANPLYLPDSRVPEQDFWKKPHRGEGQNSAHEVVDHDAASPYCAMQLDIFSLPKGGMVPQPSFGSANSGPDMPHFDRQGPGQLELTPHGLIHDGIGGWMGAVSGSARDPIFWLHHANIDRFWPSWLKRDVHRKNPQEPWLSRKFILFDESGSQVQPEPTPRDFVKPDLDYEYESLDKGTGQHPVVCAQQVVSAEERVLVTSNPGHPLSLAEPTEVPLEAADDSSQAQSFLASGDVPETGLILTVKGIRSNTPPGTPYRVYLNPPQGEGQPDNDYFVGWVSFFGATDVEGGHHGHGEGNGDGNEFSYDITDRVRQLQERGLWTQDPLTVSIVPATPAPSEFAASPYAPRPSVEHVIITTR
ncbi:tyrosinase family protein [Streptomyces chattanoogensis]|uniref:tyrosinase family protein n=1 Tax=Streptomyces chattanoogensis TaxID=66876 RepID=UPI00369134C4